MDIIRKHLRDVPDFPKPGILFKDITPLLANPAAFDATINALVEQNAVTRPDVICGIESRGFIFGATMARAMKIGFIPARKPGKLPYRTICETYALEYGSNTLEMHEDAIVPGAKVLIVDDLLATGGTAKAASRLIERLGGTVVGYAFVIELAFLSGRDVLPNASVRSLVSFD